MNVCEKLVAGLMLGTSLAAQALADSEDSRDRERERPHQVVTIDHFVPHISTVPANSGELVHLFVRERIAGSGLCACSSARQDRAPEEREDDGDKRASREVVLMIHGRSIPVLPVADLGDDDYNWALSLARAGIDVFLMGFQGSGRSPRPKMEDPCNVPIAQQALLIPKPLQNTCTPKYAGRLNTGQSDWDELDRVVDYIRELRGIDKVHLISWSQGSFRIGPYAVQHPDKVDSLLMYAPIYNPAGRAGTGSDGFAPPVTLPQPGTPMTLTMRSGLIGDRMFGTGLWGSEIQQEDLAQCGNQVEDGIQDVVWSAIMANDELGSNWGPPPAGAPDWAPVVVSQIFSHGRPIWMPWPEAVLPFGLLSADGRLSGGFG